MKIQRGEAGSSSSYRCDIDPSFRGDKARSRIEDPEGLMADPACRIIHSGRNRVAVVELPSPQGGSEPFVVKEFRPKGLKLLRTVFTHSPARKAWLGSRALQGRGLATPRPVACLEKRRGPWLEKCFLITAYAGDAQEIRGMFQTAAGDRRRALLKGLALFLAHVHREGILHRDLSDGNILVDERNGRTTFQLVDTNRIRRKKRIGRLRGVRNLNRLGLLPDQRRSFLEEYLGVPDVPRHLWIWYRLNKGWYSFMIAFKKRLRLRRLAEKLGIQ